MTIAKQEKLARLREIRHQLHSLPPDGKGAADLIGEAETIWQGLAEQIDLAAPLSDLPDMTVNMFDREGRTLYINSGGARARGRDESFFVNKKMTELFSPGVAAERMKKLEELFVSGKATRFLDRNEGFVLDVFLYPIFGEGGKVTRVVTFARDITEQEKISQTLRESEERYRDIVERANSIILRWNREGVIVYANDFTLNFFRYGRDELVGKSLFGTLLADGAESRRMLADIVAEPEKHMRHRNVNTARDGQEFWIAWTNRAIPDEAGRVAEIVSVGNDITERLAFEERLHRLNEELREKQEKLEAANKELHAFTYTAAHDLRSPLTSIDGFSALLLDTEELSESGRDSLLRIRRSADRMNRLIGSLLDFAKAEHRVLAPEDVDLSRIAGEIAAEHAAVGPAAKAEFSIQPGVVVRADSVLLHEVMHNLLGNALKYSARAERPRVGFSARAEGKEIVCRVTDNGVGFDMKNAKRIFRPFERLHPKSEYEGTGIGLATVERIVRRHGGRVWAESSPGAGAEFCFSLPLPG